MRRSGPAKLILLGASVILAACSAGSTSTSPTPTETAPAATSVAIPVATLRPVVAELQHQLPDVEAVLPTVVAGRTMKTWSVRGADFASVQGVASVADLEAIKADTAARYGLELDDVGLAVAGRSDVDADPPHVVKAYWMAGVPAETLPSGVGCDYPDAGTWTEATVGGKDVLIGTATMLEQTENVPVRPYQYNAGDIRFVITANDEAWAADALRQLP